jgi:acyl-CoA synthetase (AMP-forming)/AMP-acid ligase II
MLNETGYQFDETMPRFFDYLNLWVQGQPAQVAYVYNDRYTNYIKFWNEAKHFAKYLLKTGVQKGDRLACIMTPRPELLTFYLASTMIGAIMVEINVHCMPSEIAYILDNSGSSHILTTYSYNDVKYQDYLAENFKQGAAGGQVWVAGGCAELPNAITYEEIMQGDYSEFDDAWQNRISEIGPDDELLMVYTSGAAGQPQSTLLTHRNVIAQSLTTKDEWLAPAGIQPGDHILLAVPSNDASSLAGLYAAPMIAGCTQYLFENYDPANTQKLIDKYRIDLIPNELVF